MPHPTRRRTPRRVVLESIPRRDAAQRLSLAFTLLARDQMERGVAPRGADAADRASGGPAGGSPSEEAAR